MCHDILPESQHRHPDTAWFRKVRRYRSFTDGDYRPLVEALQWRQAPRAAHGALARAHDSQYITGVLAAVPSSGRIELEGSGTVISSGSGEAALRAAGAVCAAVDAVAAGEGKNSFCAVRPPGHHAEPSRTMGFCLFNNVAVGALHARIAHGFRRIAVVDFDVHHGNGGH
ncbi:MAG: hypothetical protein IH878_05165 [Gemmatimonadetes bacterium]|nr:hypothetical protein [Gemmatimonadota bacterium]